MAARQRGTVLWYRTDRGQGFIQPEGATSEAENLFVHHSDLKMEGFRHLVKNQAVSFASENYNGRLKAVDVMIEGLSAPRSSWAPPKPLQATNKSVGSQRTEQRWVL